MFINSNPIPFLCVDIIDTEDRIIYNNTLATIKDNFQAIYDVTII